MDERSELAARRRATNPDLAARFETAHSELRACIAAESKTDPDAEKASMPAGYARLKEDHPELAEQFTAQVEGHLADTTELERKIEIAALRAALTEFKKENPLTAARWEEDYADALAELPPDWAADDDPGADSREQAPRPRQTVVEVAEGRYEVRNEPPAGEAVPDAAETEKEQAKRRGEWGGAIGIAAYFIISRYYPSLWTWEVVSGVCFVGVAVIVGLGIWRRIKP